MFVTVVFEESAALLYENFALLESSGIAERSAFCEQHCDGR
jgi:hypothetical protein